MGTSARPPLEPLFTTEAVHDFRIDLDAEDWQSLRGQRRSLLEQFFGACQADPHTSPFTYFSATITVDGTEVGPIGVRKKGWIGSVRSDRPSLRLNFDEYVAGLDLAGVDDLVLGNSVEDATRMNQCLGYALFQAAGVPAPRCGFARVTVNGEDLGLYVLLEAVDKDFLEQHFADATGPMYEGVFSDFREGWLGTFEPETAAARADTTSLAAVAAAASRPDGELVAALGEVVDLDRFMTFWAMESLLRHGDGYARAANNFHAYRDPQTGRFVFMPHGIDRILFDDVPYFGGSTAVYARAGLTTRLIALDATRAAYEARLRELLGTVWDADAIRADIARLSTLLAPHVPVADRPVFEDAVARLDAFIAGREAAVLAALEAGELTPQPMPETVCWPEVGTLEATFTAPWGTLFPPRGGGTGTLAVTIDGASPTLGSLAARAGTFPGDAETAVVQIVGQDANNVQWRAQVSLPLSAFAAGTFAVDLLDIEAELVGPNPNGQGTAQLALIGPATLVLEQAGTAANATVKGRLSGTLTRRP